MSSSHSTPASFNAAKWITPQISDLFNWSLTCSMCSIFAGSARRTVRVPSFCIDMSRISDSKPTLIASKPRCSRIKQISSAIPHPSSVTTTVPDNSNGSSLPRHSSTSTCHLRQPDLVDESTSVSIAELVEATGCGISDLVTAGSGVATGSDNWLPCPLIFRMYAVK